MTAATRRTTRTTLSPRVNSLRRRGGLAALTGAAGWGGGGGGGRSTVTAMDPSSSPSGRSLDHCDRRVDPGQDRRGQRDEVLLGQEARCAAPARRDRPGQEGAHRQGGVAAGLRRLDHDVLE